MSHTIGEAIPVPESIRQLAELLQSQERPENGASVFYSCDRLRPSLILLAGKAGFRATLSRALAIAKRDCPWLGRISITEEGYLSGLDEGEPLTPQEIAKGGTILTAHLLYLLQTFLGGALMLRLVHDLWPDVSFDGLSNGKESLE